jgi:hypothetical protein
MKLQEVTRTRAEANPFLTTPFPALLRGKAKDPDNAATRKAKMTSSRNIDISI